jgi:hypothetical protein
MPGNYNLKNEDNNDGMIVIIVIQHRVFYFKKKWGKNNDYPLITYIVCGVWRVAVRVNAGLTTTVIRVYIFESYYIVI